MLKIKDDVDLKELEKFGFEYDNVSCYMLRGYYQLEDDGTSYIDDNGFDYRWEIDITETTRNLFIEVINNDCSYHNEGSDIDDLFEVIYKLIKADLVEVVE